MFADAIFSNQAGAFAGAGAPGFVTKRTRLALVVELLALRLKHLRIENSRYAYLFIAQMEEEARQ